MILVKKTTKNGLVQLKYIGVKTYLFSLFKPFLLYFLLNFLFYIGVQPINNVVTVSGAQRRDSAVHIYVSILLQTSLLSRLPHNIKQNFMCYTGSLLVIHFKYSS